jgi:TPR repeat protein
MIFSNVRLLPVKQLLSILMVITFSIFIEGCGEEKMSVAALQKAAEQGNVKAQYILGVRYLSGEGIPKIR